MEDKKRDANKWDVLLNILFTLFIISGLSAGLYFVFRFFNLIK